MFVVPTTVPLTTRPLAGSFHYPGSVDERRACDSGTRATYTDSDMASVRRGLSMRELRATSRGEGLTLLRDSSVYVI